MNPAPPVTKAFIRPPNPKGIGARQGIPGRRRAALLLSPTNATDHHREKQHSQEDRRDPRPNEAKENKTFKVPFYNWTDADGGEPMTIGLKGHFVPSFPEGYSKWQKTRPDPRVWSTPS